MFEKLKRILREVVDVVTTKQISVKEFDEKYADKLIIDLVESDVALPVAEEIVSELRSTISNIRVRRGIDVQEYLRNEIKRIIRQVFRNVGSIDLENELKKRNLTIIVFLGVNGVGKTTTIAKLGYRFRKLGYRPLFVAADTFRAGAQEQLKEHGKRLGIPVFSRPYGTDPAAVVYDSIVFAKQNKFDIILVDTAGRMHTDIDLMDELRKIIRVGKPHYKILVVDALTGNDAVEQAKLFNDKIGVDGVIVTKLDADVKGGTILSVVHTIRKPVLYIGVGQKYEDLRRFDVDWLIDTLI